MPPPRSLLKFFVPAVLAAGTALRAAPIQHDFLAIDEGLVQLLHINERDPSRNWIVPVAHSTPRDLQLVGGGRVLVGHDAGYTEYDLTTGKVVKDVGSFKGITSARRLPNGHTLLAGVNLDGSTGVVIIEIDDTGAVVKKLVYPGDYVRLIRETEQGTFLMMTNTMIREGDRDGKIIHEFPVDGFKHAWKALRLPNGHIIASAGYGAFMVELDASGAVVRKWGAKGQTPPEVNPNFYATFQLLSNGDIVLANWQGHGKNHGASGKQIIEFNPAGDAIVWEWSDAKIISTLQGVLVLDGLDTSLLYDEREGLMKPLK